jgi:hypothetical protein
MNRLHSSIDIAINKLASIEKPSREIFYRFIIFLLKSVFEMAFKKNFMLFYINID